MRFCKRTKFNILTGVFFLIVLLGSYTNAQAAVKIQLAEKVDKINIFSRFTLKIKPIEDAVEYSLTIKRDKKEGNQVWSYFYTTTHTSETENITIDIKDWERITETGQAKLQVGVTLANGQMYTQDFKVQLTESSIKAPDVAFCFSDGTEVSQEQLKHFISYGMDLKVSYPEAFDGVITRWICDGKIRESDIHYLNSPANVWTGGANPFREEGDWRVQASLIIGDNSTAWSKPIKINRGYIGTTQNPIKKGEPVEVIIKGADTEHVSYVQAKIRDEKYNVIHSLDPVTEITDPMIISLPGDLFDIGDNSISVSFHNDIKSSDVSLHVGFTVIE